MRNLISSLGIALLLLSAACATIGLEKSLAPDDKDFLSYVRYIITREERKAFLNLPPSARDEFIEEFWKKRDPDPETEPNEYREDYFKRIEEANHLFKSGGAPGWLQDRGRIYILLGPPDERRTYPRGQGLYDKPYEEWYYGFFPILFIDNNWTDDYALEPLSAMQITLINEAQMERKSKKPQAREGLEFVLKVEKTKADEIRVEVRIPIKIIRFSREGFTLKTTLELFLEITTRVGAGGEPQKVREEHKSYPLAIEDKDWVRDFEKTFRAELSYSGLPKGNFDLLVKIRNNADGREVQKREKFTL